MTDAALPDTAHLTQYLDAWREGGGAQPRYVEELQADDETGWDNLLYPVGEDIYVHIRPAGTAREYHVVEPRLSDSEKAALHQIRDRVFEAAMYRAAPRDAEELEQELLELFDGSFGKGGVEVPKDRRPVLRYNLIRDVSRYGPLQPLILDPYLEDIHAVGTEPVHIIHKFFDMLLTNVRFESVEHLDNYVRNLSERVGRPVSDARPIVDATLQDGSRINIVYSTDVSRKGPSFSIRRVKTDPISVTQLIQWGTMSAEVAAYVWLCLENGMNVFVCGEAACGKSATLNAFTSFIDPRSKIYTAEDTPELRPPHPVWQRLLTRETGPVQSRVQMFDLLKAALRSRPNYIIVGEIRGAEGAVAFQGMQTGHPSMATFHATDKVKMIQRLSSPPISIPLTFIDNLNVAVFQQAMYRDDRLVRRVTAVDEIQGYSEFDGGVVTLPVFSYDAGNDRHTFQGRNNSFVLEKKIAEQHGYEDPLQIYRDLDRRARILQAMADHGILHHAEVNRLVFAYHDRGEDALPFKV